MLGVMTVRQSELRFREFDRYRGVYCGLCRAIGKRGGAAGRLALSFEMTFMAMLLTSLYEPETAAEMRRCALHPVKKRLMLSNDAIDYCADMSALTTYYDLQDGWEDEKKVGHLAASALLRRAAQRAGARWPRQRDAVVSYVERLHEVERHGEENLDAAANLTGAMLAELYVIKEDVYSRDLRELGFSIGKFIYLCDCYEDVERDAKKHNYNPLIARSADPEFAVKSEQMLSAIMAQAALAFERLPLIEDAEIMRNILYSGIWMRFEQATERRKAKKES